MTEKLFWLAPYQTTLSTTLCAVTGADVELAATIFFAESGGQERDHGSIAGRTVLAAHKDHWFVRETVGLLRQFGLPA